MCVNDVAGNITISVRPYQTCQPPRAGPTSRLTARRAGTYAGAMHSSTPLAAAEPPPARLAMGPMAATRHCSVTAPAPPAPPAPLAAADGAEN
jgi:hypothetical protein